MNQDTLHKTVQLIRPYRNSQIPICYNKIDFVIPSRYECKINGTSKIINYLIHCSLFKNHYNNTKNCIIYSHTRNGNRFEGLELVNNVSNNLNCDVITYDFSGCGSSYNFLNIDTNGLKYNVVGNNVNISINPKPLGDDHDQIVKGEYITYGGKEVYDLYFVYNYASFIYDNIVFYGRSMGASVSLLAASKFKFNKLKCIIVDSPYDRLSSSIKNIIPLMLEINAGSNFLGKAAKYVGNIALYFNLLDSKINEICNIANNVIGEKMFNDRLGDNSVSELSNLDPIKNIGKIKVPILFGVCDQDVITTPEMVNNLHNAASDKQIFVFNIYGENIKNFHAANRPYDWFVKVINFYKEKIIYSEIKNIDIGVLLFKVRNFMLSEMSLPQLCIKPVKDSFFYENTNCYLLNSSFKTYIYMISSFLNSPFHNGRLIDTYEIINNCTSGTFKNKHVDIPEENKNYDLIFDVRSKMTLQEIRDWMKEPYMNPPSNNKKMSNENLIEPPYINDERWLNRDFMFPPQINENNRPRNNPQHIYDPPQNNQKISRLPIFTNVINNNQQQLQQQQLPQHENMRGYYKKYKLKKSKNKKIENKSP